MTGARETEPAFNARLAEVLGRKHPRWKGTLGSERTAVLHIAARRPDVVVLHPGGLPVIVETEFEPARGVEQDAIRRLGETLAASGRAVEQALALRIPEALRQGGGDIAAGIEGACFRYCVFTGTAQRPERWPQEGWIAGGIDDVAAAIELAALSESRIAQGVTVLEVGIGGAALALREAGADTLQGIAAILRQEKGEQTWRMAMAIVANALCFHTAVAGAHDIPPLAGLHGQVAGGPLKTKLLECWQRVLDEINYWPIFAVASDLLRIVPDGIAQKILEQLEGLANDLAALGATSQHDLSGRMFQRLIADRKFLATFYTLPASAALLAEMAVARLAIDWSWPQEVAELRMADFACGTGALIGAAYRAARSRHRLAGGDDGTIHAAMMERALIAADIMPAATHLTATTLSSAHPACTFADTRIVTLPYGEQAGRQAAIGALDLIWDEAAWSLFGTRANRVRGAGAEREEREVLQVDLAHGTMNLVIMNPPFTRPTNHEATGMPVPSFAGFKTSADEQRAMSQRLEQIRRGQEMPAGHGNAGLASNFVDLAHAKVAPGGTIALVLPASCLQGRSWRGMRALLAARYRDLTVVAIAATGATERAFSADTGMAEVLIVATRRKDGAPGGPACFVNLDRRPATLLEAVETARAIRHLPGAGDGILTVGDRARAGCFVRAPFSETGCAGLREPLLAGAAMALREGRLALPRLERPLPLPIVRLGELGERGPLHRDINGVESGKDGRPRGPFDIHSTARAAMASYPVLWRHDAARETRLAVAADAEGRPRAGQAARAAALWNRAATRLHFNQDFQINSQPLAACLTPQATIGGRAWPGFRPHDEAWEAPLLLWANTTLGLLAFWWLGTRQQQGRAVLTLSALPGLAAIDPRALDGGQLAQARAILAAFRERSFLPANEAWRDESRQALDRAVLIDWLGLPEAVLEPLAVLRRQWCAEPSVHGGKATRPVG